MILVVVVVVDDAVAAEKGASVGSDMVGGI